MTRAFSGKPVDQSVISSIVDLASRAPSAGKTQGWHLVVLQGPDVAKFWDDTLPADRRESFRFKKLLDAPIIALPFADPDAYVERYSLPDKEQTGLGSGVDAWATPYWTVDTSFAVMTLLHAAHDLGLGALFFAVFNGENELRSRLEIPEHLQLLGAIAIGWPLAEESAGGASAQRPRRKPDEIIHHSKW
jgi:nitroreductase